MTVPPGHRVVLVTTHYPPSSAARDILLATRSGARGTWCGVTVRPRGNLRPWRTALDVRAIPSSAARQLASGQAAATSTLAVLSLRGRGRIARPRQQSVTVGTAAFSVVARARRTTSDFSLPADGHSPRHPAAVHRYRECDHRSTRVARDARDRVLALPSRTPAPAPVVPRSGASPYRCLYVGALHYEGSDLLVRASRVTPSNPRHGSRSWARAGPRRVGRSSATRLDAAIGFCAIPRRECSTRSTPPTSSCSRRSKVCPDHPRGVRAWCSR
jgi:hypothetical protein